MSRFSSSEFTGTALLILLVAGLYGRALGFGFVVDDHALIANNPALSDWSTLPAALGHDLFHHSDLRASPYWRPLVTLTYYIDQAVGGGAPWAFHLSNLVFVLALGLGLRRLQPGWSGVALAAVVLAHPLQVEGAVCIASRTDVLCAMFLVWALRAGPVAATALTAAACFSKELGILVPVVLALERRPWKGPAAVALLYLGCRALVPLGLVEGDAVLGEVPGRATWMLTRLIAPAFEGFSTSGTAWPIWTGLVGAVVVAAVGWRRPAAAVLMVVPVVLVSGLLGLVRAADALLVIPLVGAALVLGRDLRLLLPLAAAGAVVSALRVPLYADDLTLWEASHAARPVEVQPRLGIARAVVDEDPGRALALLQIHPVHPREQREVYEVRARALFASGDTERAVLDLRQAAWDDPEAAWANAMLCVHTHERGPCEVATRRSPQDGAVWNGLGIAHIQRSNVPEALKAFETACSLDDAFCGNAEKARQDLLELQGVPGGEGSRP